MMKMPEWLYKLLTRLLMIHAALSRSRFAQNRRGITGMILALLITLVSLAILLPVGLLLTAQIAQTVNTYALGTSGNATRLALLITLVSLAILLPVGLLLTAQISQTVNTYALGTSGNATRLAVLNNIWAAFNLSAIIPIVAAAGIIIAVIIGAFAMGPRR